MKTVAIIGLGRFGYQIAEGLSKLEYSVIAVDRDKTKVQEISEHVENSFVVDSTNAKALEEVGIVDLDLVIVSIGEDIEASILTVMALGELKNKNIIAKATSLTHGKILSKIGVFKIVYPERVAAKNLIQDIVLNIAFDVIDISSQVKVLKVIATNFAGRRIREIEETNHGKIKAIALKHNNTWGIDVDKDYVVKEDDFLCFVTYNQEIQGFYMREIEGKQSEED